MQESFQKCLVGINPQRKLHLDTDAMYAKKPTRKSVSDQENSNLRIEE